MPLIKSLNSSGSPLRAAFKIILKNNFSLFFVLLFFTTSSFTCSTEAFVFLFFTFFSSCSPPHPLQLREFHSFVLSVRRWKVFVLSAITWKLCHYTYLLFVSFRRRFAPLGTSIVSSFSSTSTTLCCCLYFFFI